MLNQLRPALVMLAVFTLLTGLIYPLAFVGIAGLVARDRAGGSLIERNGIVVGSALVGQQFVSDRYFHPRPSAAGDGGYDASSSAASNLGPISAKLIARVGADVAALRAGGVTGPIPVDAVTASASGLDPDISPENALMQVPRVARARGLDATRVEALVEARAEGRGWAFLGEPHVNVLALNLALDALQP